MKKLLILTTGGTIASVSSSDGLIPKGSFQIIRHFDTSDYNFEITFQDILLLDSADIQPEEWQVIAKKIYNCLRYYDAIIVTHGTDTLAYTSSMMSFMIQNPNIPIVFTGSQLPIDHPLTDAVSNLNTAIAMCLTKTPGIFVAFDRRIIAANRAVKVRTTAFNAFESINTDLVGKIDSNGLTLNNSVIFKSSLQTTLHLKVNKHIEVIKLTPTFNPKVIDIYITSGCKGLIIEAYGLGGISSIRRDLVSKIKEAVDKNIVVVVTSQCLYEKSNFKVYQVGQKVIAKGAIESYDMTTEAILTKLMHLLGNYEDINRVKEMFKTNISGEMTPII